MNYPTIRLGVMSRLLRKGKSWLLSRAQEEGGQAKKDGEWWIRLPLGQEGIDKRLILDIDNIHEVGRNRGRRELKLALRRQLQENKDKLSPDTLWIVEKMMQDAVGQYGWWVER